MRRYGMYDASRGLTLALTVGLVGLALWGATQVGTNTTGRFWLSMVIVAAAGLLLSLATHVGSWTKGLRLRPSLSTFALVFLPVLVIVGWILIASQPGSGWEEGRITSWSNSIGILGPVHSIGLWSGVLAFGFGIVLGLTLDGIPAPEPAVEAEPGYGAPTMATMPGRTAAASASNEPVTAERRWFARRRGKAPQGAPADDTADEAVTRTQERTPTH